MSVAGTRQRQQGAVIDGDAIRFRVWARGHRRASIELFAEDGRTGAGSIPMHRTRGGWFEASAPAGGPRLYKIRVDGAGPFPDPWSRSQPFGVHGPSEVLGPLPRGRSFPGVALEDLVIYEVHAGAATPEGTFDALIPRLAEIRALGATAIELMPVASFPGRWNWGYDGVSLFAPAAPYGGPMGLLRLVDAAHETGLGVILDVVYNHLGPDGNYLRSFSDRYYAGGPPTPWGQGLCLREEVARELICANAEMWIRDYGIDGLRLDATDTLVDDGDPHILQEIADRARAAGEGRRVLVIAEDDRNEARLLSSRARGGYGLDAVWAGDFHYVVRRAFAGDHEGLFADYRGTAAEIAAVLTRGWLFEGAFAKRTNAPRGTPAGAIPPQRFVHFVQNHDQIGNRAHGDRLGHAVGASALRAMSALLLLSPYTPLLFMGEEWNASAPFQFFTDHHEELGRRVREGRQREHASSSAFAKPDVPDPQDPATFQRSKLDWSQRERQGHAGVLALHHELLRLRAEHPALRARDRASFSARALGNNGVMLERRGGGARLAVIVSIRGPLTHAAKGMRLVLTTEEERFGGLGSSSARSVLSGGVLRIAGPMAAVLEGS